MRTPSQRSSRNLERLEGRPPEQAIPHLLKSLHHSLRQVMDEMLRREKIDVSFAHFVTLLALETEPGLPGAELARRNFVTAQTMNTILHRLERDGQIERRPHPLRARADSWFVTRKGQGQLEKAKVVAADIWRGMLSALAPREVTQLQNSLERCLRSLGGGRSESGPAKGAASMNKRAPARKKKSAARSAQPE